MKKKLCSKCKTQKNLIEFNIDANTKSGYRSQCKLCIKEIYIKNKILNKLKKNYNPDKKAEYYKNKKLEILTKNKEYYDSNKVSILNQKHKYYELNKEERLKSQKKYYQKNKEEKIKHHNEKMKNDSLYKFKHNTRTLIRGSFKRCVKGIYKKGNLTESILGCSMKKFILYIELNFKEDMSLDNHGKWHLDHIIPLATAKTEEEIIKLNHYTNFQPLWAKDNLSKGCKETFNK
jgi:hypothetical protein